MKRNSAPIFVSSSACEGLAKRLLTEANIYVGYLTGGKPRPSKSVVDVVGYDCRMAHEIVNIGPQRVRVTLMTSGPTPSDLGVYHHPVRPGGLGDIEVYITPDVTCLHLQWAPVDKIDGAAPGGLRDAIASVIVHEVAHAIDPGYAMEIATGRHKRGSGGHINEPRERVAWKTEILHEVVAAWPHYSRHVTSDRDIFAKCLEASPAYRDMMDHESPEAEKDILKSVYQGIVQKGLLP